TILKWLRIWNPFEIQENDNIFIPYESPSAIVKIAMKNLTKFIDMSIGVIHPDDEDMIKTYVRVLHTFECSLNADEIEAYLIRELGWNTNQTIYIEKLIKQINKCNKYNGRLLSSYQTYYDSWVQ